MDGSLRLRPALALAVAVALGATSAGSAVSAQTPTWVRLGGPQGGVVVALAASVHGGRVLYAATDAGVFRSRNGGASWAPAVRGLPEETPSSLAVDATRPQVLYAAGFDGAYRSSNGGASWKPCTRGLANVEFGDVGAPVVADPRVSGIVYLLADTGLYRSTDSGVSWRRADRGLPGDLGVPAVDPRRSNVLYVFAGSRGGRLYRSSDRGAHWKAVGGRLPAQDFLATVLVDPVAESTLYAAGRGVYTSVDGGRSWHPVGGGLAKRDVQALVVGGGTLYVATDREVYSSATRGDGAWRRAGSGLSAGFVWSLALDAGGRGGLYAGTDSGVFRSRPAGGRWRAVDKGLTGWSVTAVAPDSRSSATVYAGTAGAGVFKSGDRGRTWGTVNRGLRGAIVQTLADDPSDPKTVYVGTYEVLDGAFAGPTRLYKSTDGAASWDLLEPGGADGFAFDPQAPATVYSLSGSLLRSTDRGGTWTPLMNGLPPPDPEGVGTRVVAVAVDPQQPSTLYIGTINGALAAVAGIFKSTDAGATWTESDAGLERRFPTALAVDPRDPATIYAGTSSGVLVSRDAGATWAVAGASSPRGDVSVVLVDPRRPATVYAATAGAGVFESADAGRSWATLDRELSAPRVLALAPDAGATSLYAGTQGGGVFRLALPG